MALKGRTALVTGAGSGIGRAVAARYAAEGARIGLVGRRESKLRDTAERIREAGGDCLVIPLDVTEEADARQMVEETVGRFGGLDVLVNAAGIIAAGTVESTALEDWDRMFE